MSFATKTEEITSLGRRLKQKIIVNFNKELQAVKSFGRWVKG
jgi:hypothetical protein